MTNVLDAYMVDSEVSFLDKAKIQAQVLVPVIRALRDELGKDKADALVKQALSGWSRRCPYRSSTSAGRPARARSGRGRTRRSCSA